MSTNFSKIEPLNWKRLVAEAIKRRKQEKLTQKEHALITGVSVPTMFDFEQCKTTLSLKKAFDILAVVGLIQVPKDIDKLSEFIEISEERWVELVIQIYNKHWVKEKGSDASRVYGHSFGWNTISFELVGNIRNLNEQELWSALAEAQPPTYSGWRPFLIPPVKDAALNLVERGLIEFWNAYENYAQTATPDCTDFWRISSDGYMHLHRGYQEDDLGIAPGKVFCLEIRILRLAEVVLHSSRLAKLMAENINDLKLNFNVSYKGLLGRRLHSLDGILYEHCICRQFAIDQQITFSASSICDNAESATTLTDLVFQILNDVFSHFDSYQLSRDFVESKITTMLNNPIYVKVRS